MIECKECNKEFSRYCDLSKHINIIHGGIEQYYNKWVKKEEEGKCKVCGEKAKFRNLTHGYNHVCSKKECLYKFKGDNIQKGLMEKYGAHASAHIKEIKEKQEKTCIKKYGVTSPLASEIIQNKSKLTNIKKYGHENPWGSEIIRDKIKETNIEKYGFENAGQNEEIKKKIRESMMKNHGVNSYLEKRDEIKKGMIKKYGVEYILQDRSSHTKQQMSGFKCKLYKESNIYYRGSYELDFLEKFYDKIDIENGPSVKYKYKSKNRVYHSDFYIPSKNLVVEIKNSYYAKRDYLILERKMNSILNEGFKYIMITDKDYSEFLIYLK